MESVGDLDAPALPFIMSEAGRRGKARDVDGAAAEAGVELH